MCVFHIKNQYILSLNHNFVVIGVVNDYLRISISIIKSHDNEVLLRAHVKTGRPSDRDTVVCDVVDMNVSRDFR